VRNLFEELDGLFRSEVSGFVILSLLGVGTLAYGFAQVIIRSDEDSRLGRFLESAAHAVLAVAGLLIVLGQAFNE
jgi:hypothetical protein